MTLCHCTDPRETDYTANVRFEPLLTMGVEFDGHEWRARSLGDIDLDAWHTTLAVECESCGWEAYAPDIQDLDELDLTRRLTEILATRLVQRVERNDQRELEIDWNARAQTSVDPDPSDFQTYDSNDGQKYLVIRVAVTNTGETL